MKVLTIDIGGTLTKYAIMDENFNMTDKNHIMTPDDNFENFINTINEIYQNYKDEVDGIAISIFGFVDNESGVIKGGGKTEFLINKNLLVTLEKLCNTKVSIENDGKCAAKAEYHNGVLKGCKNAAVFVIGTGVGGGLIINGEIVKGIHHTAGEYSFMSCAYNRFDGPDCFVGYNCSTRGLLDTYQKIKNSNEEIDGIKFFSLLDKDTDAQKVFDDFTKKIAIQIYNLFWLLDIEKIAIGGGISAQEKLIDKINEQFQSLINSNPLLTSLPVKELEILKAKYGNDANLIGAYLTYKEKFNL